MSSISSTVIAVRPKDDRRAPDRFSPESCIACGSEQTVVVSRTDYVLYVRCATCGRVVSTSKRRGAGALTLAPL